MPANRPPEGYLNEQKDRAGAAPGIVAARPDPTRRLDELRGELAKAGESNRPAAGSQAEAGGIAGRTAGKPESASPAALYFNPQLVTDSRGQAMIRFVMPQVDSEYRLLIDALGDGRIGSRQQILICGDSPAK